MDKPRIYVAGPDVFRKEAAKIFERRFRVLEQLGLIPVKPVDDAKKSAETIYSGNREILDNVHAVIANVTPFRGPHCDVGTAWEIGYAVARDKRVFAFSEDRRRIRSRIFVHGQRPGRYDGNGFWIESGTENLMIERSVVGGRLFPNFESAARAAAQYFRRHPIGRKEPHRGRAGKRLIAR